MIKDSVSLQEREKEEAESVWRMIGFCRTRLCEASKGVMKKQAFQNDSGNLKSG